MCTCRYDTTSKKGASAFLGVERNKNPESDVSAFAATLRRARPARRGDVCQLGERHGTMRLAERRPRAEGTRRGSSVARRRGPALPGRARSCASPSNRLCVLPRRPPRVSLNERSALTSWTLDGPVFALAQIYALGSFLFPQKPFLHSESTQACCVVIGEDSQMLECYLSLLMRGPWDNRYESGRCGKVCGSHPPWPKAINNATSPSHRADLGESHFTAAFGFTSQT